MEDVQAAFERGDYPVAAKFLRGLAERGDARAQYNLGLMYGEGRGVAKDDSEAVRWYRKAAEQGHAMADTKPMPDGRWSNGPARLYWKSGVLWSSLRMVKTDCMVAAIVRPWPTQRVALPGINARSTDNFAALTG